MDINLNSNEYVIGEARQIKNKKTNRIIKFLKNKNLTIILISANILFFLISNFILFFDSRLPDISRELNSINIKIIINGEEYRLGFNRERVFNYSFASSYPPIIKHKQEIFRLISATYQHSGLLHLGINMFSLFLIGKFFETIYGKYRFFIIYTISGIGSTLLSYLSKFSFTLTMSVGASGCLFGLIGALVAFALINKHKMEPLYRKNLLGNLTFIIILNLLIGFSIPGIDNIGHIGGLIAGLGSAFFIQPVIFFESKKETKKMKIAFLTTLSIVIISIILNFIWYFSGKSFNNLKNIFKEYAPKMIQQSVPNSKQRIPTHPQEREYSDGEEI